MIVHPYLRFRVCLARHAIAQLIARLRSSAEIIVLLLGPATLGALAFAAMPAMLAASQPIALAVTLLLAHGLVMSLPVAVLRQRLVPPPVCAWLRTLPIPPQLELHAALAVSAVLGMPLALVYAASLAIWLHQAPAWLASGRAVAGTVASLLLTWAASTWWLMLAARMPPAGAGADQQLPKAATANARYVAYVRPGRWPLWRLLFWLPSWRNSSLAGRRQAILLAGTLAAVWLWMYEPALVPRSASAVLTSALLIALVHDTDTVLRAHVARLREAAAGWPVAMTALVLRARWMVLPAAIPPLALLVAGGMAAHAWTHTAGRAYLALACCTPPLLVFTPPFTARGRVALVALLFMILSATGSAIWN